MTFVDFCNAVEEAETTQRRADECISQLADMCVNRLRSSGVSGYVLSRLKRELKNWDSVRRCWKNG